MDAIKQPTSPAVEGSRNQTLSDTVHDGYVLANGFAQSCIDGGPPIGNDSQADPKRVSRPKDINVTHEKPESQAGKTTPGYPSLPRLGRSSSSPPRTAPSSSHLEGEDEGQEQATARCFPRSPTPSSTTSKTKVAQNHEVGKEGVCRMHKFSLYETSSRYFMVGGDIVDKKFRILKIDRTSESGSLNVAEDGIIYTKNEMNRLLNAVDDGNKSSGGLKLKCTNCWGLLGFIRFTGAYYMLMITKRSQIALIGGHYIYQVDGTELVPLTSSSSFRSKSERDSEEVRFIGILNNLDLSRSFYFSYSYDITRTLQQNIVREREALKHEQVDTLQPNHNAMFVWNHYFLQPVLQALKHPYDWCLPIVHGFIDQAKLSIYGRNVYVTVIARRSRLFAGARFLKRGVNDLGYVANDVETEQIVSEMLTTSFHAPGPKLFENPGYTSYVQHRGSIPLHWTQDNTGVTPKPDIELNLVDPFYSATALHFDDLFRRYGAPVYVLNLVKARERTPRESILLEEYTNAINYLNQFLPTNHQIIYKAWDMSRAAKSRDQDVIGTLESIAEHVMASTGFFRNGNNDSNDTKLQNGVARTNCIDCLDRTNAAQFVIGKRALGYQLYALGLIGSPSVEYDTDAVNLFTQMFHDHGDTIAIQYGGSHLVNTMETYRKINQWSSQSRDMVESFKRYYNNSFLDRQRQEAYNLFLGNYVFDQQQPMLWDLATDYYLHHAHPRAWATKNRKSYIKWYTPDNLERRNMPQVPRTRPPRPLELLDDYWLEYYRPLAVSNFAKILSLKLSSTLRYTPFKLTQDAKYDMSPFHVRSGPEHDSPEKERVRKEGVVVSASPSAPLDSFPSALAMNPQPFQRATSGWLDPELRTQGPGIRDALREKPIIIKDLIATASGEIAEGKHPKDNSTITQWTLNQFVTHSLNPCVADSEAYEYQRYINHPLNLPLVISTDAPPSPNMELVNYINSNSLDAVTGMHSTEDDIADYNEFLLVGEDPLTVTDADPSKKRYKAYRQWLKGKSLFKQQRVDP